MKIIERVAVGPKKSKQAIIVLDFTLIISAFIWALVSYQMLSIWNLYGIPFFVALAISRRYLVFLSNRHKYTDDKVFLKYFFRGRTYVYDVIGVIVMGTSGILLHYMVNIINFIGYLHSLLYFDLILLFLIIYYFFQRPGFRSTLAKSARAIAKEETLLSYLSEKVRISRPELRILMTNPSGLANAFSWSLPKRGKYIFATENLFTALEEKGVISIFAHEMGHLVHHHSEISYMLITMIPFLLFNIILLSFALNIGKVSFLVAAFSAIMFVVFEVLGKRLISTRFEDSADRFAVSFSNRLIYTESLEKLTKFNERLTGRRASDSRTHRRLEERIERILNLH